MYKLLSESLQKPRRFLLLNAAFLLLYGLLYYFITNDRMEEGFPVRLTFLIAVHSIGLLVFAMTQAGIKNRLLSKGSLLSGFVLPILGVVFIWLLY